MNTPRPAVAFVVALGLALCTATPACSSSEGETAAKAAAQGAGGYGTATSATGSGGTVIHEGGTNSGGEPGAPLVASCGEGCVPATGQATECSLPAGAGGGGGSGGATVGSCQLASDGDSVTGVCGVTGASADGAPCLTVEDCAPGLGCVEPGVCRPYCCGDVEACPAATYCAARTLRDMVKGGPTLPIPVCEPAEPCTLLDDSTCMTPGESCTIVRVDGTTSCLVPGEGKAGEACPCAAGHVCSAAEGRCLALCRTSRSEDCPAGFQCSGGNKPYPSGYGVCVEL